MKKLEKCLMKISFYQCFNVLRKAPEKEGKHERHSGVFLP
jgi:hypothetical protein